MIEKIHKQLLSIKNKEEIVICLAVESGSRAWGFPSKDSDYDIRFIYLNRPEWYLSVDLEQKRDVIERAVSEDALDFVGWDIRKALKLFRKSNPPLLEWLQSPIVYMQQYALASRMRALLKEFFLPEASYYHYLHTARGNYKDYLQGDTVPLKKYFYVLRPLMAIHWIEQGLGPVPMEFERLMDIAVSNSALKTEIRNLITRKQNSLELGKEPKIKIIHDFIEQELDKHRGKYIHSTYPGRKVDKMNELFRSTLEEVWGISIEISPQISDT